MLPGGISSFGSRGSRWMLLFEKRTSEGGGELSHDLVMGRAFSGLVWAFSKPANGGMIFPGSSTGGAIPCSALMTAAAALVVAPASSAGSQRR